MINDDKAREAAKFLKQYCHEHKSCYNCIFFRHDGECSLMQHADCKGCAFRELFGSRPICLLSATGHAQVATLIRKELESMEEK